MSLPTWNEIREWIADKVAPQTDESQEEPVKKRHFELIIPENTRIIGLGGPDWHKTEVEEKWVDLTD